MSPRADKEAAILDAALHLFAERGFHGASVPELAKRAGVGAGTIYRYFEHKDAVVNALFRMWKERLNASLYGAIGTETSWRGRVRALWYALAEFNAAHPDALEFLELHFHADYLDEASKQVEAASAAVLFDLIEAGKADEAFADLPPAALVALVYGGFLGLLRAARQGYLELTPELLSQTEERAWAVLRR